MAIDLKKGSGISLKKSSGGNLEKVCVGLNWGSIKKKSFFGLLTTNEDVDLDGSVVVFDGNKKLLDTVYFKQIKSKDGAIRHSGDDLTGDESGDDGLDNEIITIDFNKISDEAHTIVLFLNSYQKQDFSIIPYSKVRVFEGTPQRVDTVLLNFNLSADDAFVGHVSMIMGKFIRQQDSNWRFEAIGEPSESARVFDTIDVIQEKYI